MSIISPSHLSSLPNTMPNAIGDALASISWVKSIFPKLKICSTSLIEIFKVLHYKSCCFWCKQNSLNELAVDVITSKSVQWFSILNDRSLIKTWTPFAFQHSTSLVIITSCILFIALVGLIIISLTWLPCNSRSSFNSMIYYALVVGKPRILSLALSQTPCKMEHVNAYDWQYLHNMKDNSWFDVLRLTAMIDLIRGTIQSVTVVCIALFFLYVRCLGEVMSDDDKANMQVRVQNRQRDCQWMVQKLEYSQHPLSPQFTWASHCFWCNHLCSHSYHLSTPLCSK